MSISCWGRIVTPWEPRDLGREESQGHHIGSNWRGLGWGWGGIPHQTVRVSWYRLEEGPLDFGILTAAVTGVSSIPPGEAEVGPADTLPWLSQCGDSTSGWAWLLQVDLFLRMLKVAARAVDLPPASWWTSAKGWTLSSDHMSQQSSPRSCSREPLS